MNKPHCPLCRDFGWIVMEGHQLPPVDEGVAAQELLDHTLPCACEAGDKQREFIAEWTKPIPPPRLDLPKRAVETDRPRLPKRKAGLTSAKETLRSILGDALR